jgi:zeaxanthin glucosyltransferase
MTVNVNACLDNQVARFLFVVLPLSSHYNAALAIGQALVEGGHEVAWCGPEREMRPLVGPDATVYGTGKRTYREYGETGMTALKVLWDGYLMPLNRFILGAVDRAVVDYRPDVVVADQYALAGALAAYRHGVRWASLCISFLELAGHVDDLPDLPGWIREKLDQAWAMADLPVDEDVDLRFSPYLVIGLTTTALTGPTPLLRPCRLTGPALGARPNDPPFDWSRWDPERRHVLVTIGTLSEHMARDFYQRMTAAAESLAGVQTVIVAPPAAVPDPPPGVLVVPRVPMLELMPHLDAVVCHGGMGTITEALAHGVPLVVAPIRHDQPLMACQVTGAGAGIEVPFATVRPPGLANAVRAVLDVPGYRSRARDIGASFRAAGGAAGAAAALHDLARSRHDPEGAA